MLCKYWQDLESVGGLKDYSDSYVNPFEVPAGIATYTNISFGNNSFGHVNKGLDGLDSKINWGGGGDSQENLYLEAPIFDNSVLAFSLSFVNHEKNIAKGKQDEYIEKLGLWIKYTNRPVFLRIGSEFDVSEWNHYKKNTT